MSLFSQVGRRGKASAAVIFAGSLFVYLGATAVPAMAATSCSTAAGVATITVGTDDNVIARVTAGAYELSINGNNWTPCTPVVADLKVLGSDAGNETFTFFHPSDFNNHPDIVDLGNGTDTLILEDGGLPATLTRAAIADPGTADCLNLATAGNGTLVGDINCGGVADLRIDNAETVIVNGGDGADNLDAGSATFSSLAGTVAANDVHAAAAPYSANLTLNGGAGDDNLVSGDGNDNFQGGPGADSVDYSFASTGVTVDLQAGTGTGMGTDTLSDVQNATGGDFNDMITGSSLDNTLLGGDGNDTLAGAGGNDTVDGQLGDDTIDEGTAANGADFLSGGGGSDTLWYGDRTTDIVVNAGGGASSGASGEKDTVGNDFETYVTGSGNDTLNGTGNDESFDPGTGTNTVDGGGGSDYLDLSNPSVTGPATIDLSGNAGTATAGTTSDAFMNIEGIVGTSLGDTLNWDGTGTLLDFAAGPGVDTVDASTSTGGVSIDLAAFGNGHEVENAIGGSGDDVLAGNVLSNTLTGNDGVDIIDGYGGNDIIDGGLGNDSLDTDTGNTGADTLLYVNSPGKENIDNQLGFATGGDGQDSIGFFPIIKGSDFNDTIIAGQTAFGLNNRLYGRGGNDKLTGTNSSDVLNGGTGKDIIHSGGGDDLTKGGSGNDTLFGSSGDDTLIGGHGRDTGWGGSGNDLCRSIERRHSC